MSNPPLRRSARAASAKPEESAAAKAAAAKATAAKDAPAKAAATKAAHAKTAAAKAATSETKKAAKPVGRTSSRNSKRAASPEASPPPVAKRSRTKGAQSDTEDVKKPAKAPVARKPSATKVTRKPTQNGLAAVHEEPVQTKPYFNPLPTPPEHTRPANQIFVWGAGNFGQFGWGADHLGEYSAPKRNTVIEAKMKEGVFGGEDAGLEAVAAGGLHTLFIDEKGTIWSCGVNDDAALGRLTKDVPDPENLGSFLDVDELTALPHPLQSLVDEKFRAVQIAAGDSISAAISSEGELKVWGSFRASEGSLGFSGGVRYEFLPKSILELPHKPGDSEKAVSVVSGNNHLLVLTTHGNIYTWGAGEQGQLGRKILDRRKIHGTVPEKITLGARSNKAVLVGANNYSSFAVDENGDVWGWGLNTMGQTGTGVDEPRSTSDEVHSPKKVESLSKKALDGDKIVQITGGEHHTVFLTASGKVYACGRCDGGQLGVSEENGEYKNRSNPDFVDVPILVEFPDKDDPVVHISAGTHNNMAVTQGGALYAWGDESQGELGVKEQEAKTPTEVVRKDGGSWTAISAACGGQHTMGMFRKKT